MNQRPNPQRTLQGVSQVATRFGKCRQTIHTYRKDPEFPRPHYWRGKFLGFDSEEIDAFIEGLKQIGGGET